MPLLSMKADRGRDQTWSGYGGNPFQMDVRNEKYFILKEE
jgi:hypothetical protein